MPNADPSVILDQLYAAMKKKAPGIVQADLGSALADVRINTTIVGASTMEIDVIDPDWVLLTSGFLDVGGDGRLAAVDINYPADTNHWWRLTQADPSTDRDQANLTLTFEARIVAYARSHKGVKSWSRAQFTRAQAIKAMTADMIKASPKPVFISPELDDKQIVTVED